MFAITERLLLRPGWAEDAPALARAVGRWDVARNLAHLAWPCSEEDAARFLAAPCDPRRPRFLICLRDGNWIVGGIGLYGDDAAELGYWIAQDHRGRGYASEAAEAVLALADASLRLPRVSASQPLDDPASARILGKLGFRETGQTASVPSPTHGHTKLRLFDREREGRAQALAA